MAVMTYAALKAEITIDPTGIGLVSPYNAGQDGAVADALNLVRAVSVTRLFVSSYEVLQNIVPSEWTALAAGPKQQLQTLLACPTLDASNANVRSWFTTIFGAGTQTRTNLAALQTRNGSRAEVLWGEGARISAADVAAARLS